VLTHLQRERVHKSCFRPAPLDSLFALAPRGGAPRSAEQNSAGGTGCNPEMHEIECECGKVVRGRSMAQARNNLKNHRVSHGDYNRLRNRAGGSDGGGESKAERIREEAEELLRGNGRGHSSSWIAKMIDVDASPVRVAASLSHGDGFTRVGTNGGTATWQLKVDVERGE